MSITSVVVGVLVPNLSLSNTVPVVVVVLVPLVTVYVSGLATIGGYGLDNYGIKRMLPKLIVGVIVVNASFYICGLLVDLSNVVGSSAFNFVSTAAVGDIPAGDWSNSDSGWINKIAAGALIRDAILLFEQTLAEALRALGSDHSDTRLFRKNLADAYRAVGRDEDAEARFL